MRVLLSKFNGDKFRFCAFVSMVLLVFVHGYSVEPRYLEPWSAPTQVLSVSRYIEYLIVLAIAFGASLRKMAPRIYSALVGGRGL